MQNQLRMLLKIQNSDVRASISVQQRWSLDCLSTVLAPFALERVVRVADGVFVEGEQLSECVDGEVSLCVFLLIHDGGGKSLLASLSLEDLLFDRSG